MEIPLLTDVLLSHRELYVQEGGREVLVVATPELTWSFQHLLVFGQEILIMRKVYNARATVAIQYATVTSEAFLIGRYQVQQIRHLLTLKTVDAR